jgi:hypothetical protein
VPRRALHSAIYKKWFGRESETKRERAASR